MALEQITDPAEEPITVLELKAWTKIQHAVDDALLASLIKACRVRAEKYCERPIVQRTFEQTIDAFPTAQIALDTGPVQSITSVKYVDTAGVLQTLAPANYTLDKRRFPDWLLPAYGVTWPETQASANAVAIRMVAGFAGAAAVPEDIKHWLKMVGAFMYKNREAFVIDGKVTEVPGRFIDSMLDPYRAFTA